MSSNELINFCKYKEFLVYREIMSVIYNMTHLIENCPNSNRNENDFGNLGERRWKYIKLIVNRAKLNLSTFII